MILRKFLSDDLLHGSTDCATKHEEKAKISRKQPERSEKWIAEMKRPLIKIYGDDARGKLSDDRFEIMSRNVDIEELDAYTLRELAEAIYVEEPSWPRMTMVEAVKKYVGIDFGAISDDAEAVAAAKAVGVELADAAEKTWGNALYACFDQRVEEHLVQPTFITMYPVEVSPLTKRSPEDPRLTERFEFFICRAEMGNAYSELNDPIDQRERFEKQVEQRERGDDETEMLDEDFLTAMEYGMPPTGGMGMGIDRAVMLFTGQDTIREVILFPTMKPLD